MHEYTKPILPLSPDQFRRAVKVGHGRARMHVDRFGALDVRTEILDAATTCKVYDPQCEGLPTDWLADLCEAADVVGEFLDRKPQGVHWDHCLRCALLGEFAQRGNTLARQRLYETCRRTEYGDLFGVDEIIELDGVSGLLFLARKLGELADADESFRVTNTSFWAFDDQFGKGKAQQLLEQEAEHDQSLRAYLAHYARESQSEAPASRLEEPFESYISKIRTADRVLYGAGHRGRNVEAAALEPVVQIALTATDPLVLENALRCLSGSKTLALQVGLLPLLTHDNAKVRLFCARTLAHHIDPRIREVGLAALPTDIEIALELLRKNAALEDVEAILAELRPVTDDVHQHDIAFDVLDLLKDNPRIQDPRLALYVYEYSPCRNCRGSAVKFLTIWKACPAWVLEEGCHDASEEIRELCGQLPSSSAAAIM